jgi:hypothetical protein
VVDDLVAAELPSLALFDDVAVLRDPLPVDRDEPVPLVDPPLTDFELRIVTLEEPARLASMVGIGLAAAAALAAVL